FVLLLDGLFIEFGVGVGGEDLLEGARRTKQAALGAEDLRAQELVVIGKAAILVEGVELVGFAQGIAVFTLDIEGASVLHLELGRFLGHSREVNESPGLR